MGNTTSERVSGERHGSKSHRSDGSSMPHAAKEHPHKIMVGSTDDPSVFSSHDSKVGDGCCLHTPSLWGPAWHFSLSQSPVLGSGCLRGEGF